MAAAQLETQKLDNGVLVPSPEITRQSALDVEVYTAAELLDLDRTSPKVVAAASYVVNRAFAEFHHAIVGPEWDGTGPRYFSDAQIVEELGQHGRCCIIFACEDTESAGRQKVPVVVASIKPYDVALNFKALGKEPEGWAKHLEQPSLQDIKDWELSAVAVKQDPKYLGRGLAMLAVKRLEDAVLQQCRLSSNGEENIKLTIWSRTIKECNNGYWERRGFGHFSEVLYETGTFGSIKPFLFETLCKDIRLN